MKKPTNRGVKSKTILVYKYHVKKDSVGSIKERVIIHFDRHGDKVKTLKQDSEDYDKFKTILYKYDSNGKKIERSVFDVYDSLVVKRFYKYDSDDRIIEKSSVDSNGHSISEHPDVEGHDTIKKVYRYDIHGNLVKRLDYDIENKFSFEINYKYDSEHRLIESIQYNSEGNCDNKEQMKYDNGSNMIEKSVFGVNNDLIIRENMEYDNDRKIIEKRTRIGEGILEVKTLYQYDKLNRVIESKRISNSIFDDDDSTISLYEYEEY